MHIKDTLNSVPEVMEDFQTVPTRFHEHHVDWSSEPQCCPQKLSRIQQLLLPRILQSLSIFPHRLEQAETLPAQRAAPNLV